MHTGGAVGLHTLTLYTCLTVLHSENFLSALTDAGDSLVRQSSSEVVLYVGVHDGSEVVEATVPEQVDDEHLPTSIIMCHCGLQYTSLPLSGPLSSSSYQ